MRVLDDQLQHTGLSTVILTCKGMFPRFLTLLMNKVFVDGELNIVYGKNNLINSTRCYNPSIPGTQIGTQLYPKACFQGSATSTYSYPSNDYDTIPPGSDLVVTTQPPAVPWGFPSWPDYQYLGCYRAGSMGVSFTNTSNLDGVEQCLDYCYTAGGNGTLFVAVSMDYLGPSLSL